MLTDPEIQALVTSPKRITRRNPARGYAEENGHRRCSLVMECVEGEGGSFTVFVRQNSQFIENYSIGLRWQTGNRDWGSITLVRYNGPHGEVSRDEDGHYAKPHIHRMTAEEMQAGSVRPPERQREITDRYSTLESALEVFFGDAGVTNWREYFPELSQGSLFNEP